MKKLFLMLMLGIFMFSLVSADSFIDEVTIGMVKQGNTIQLTQVCQNCTYVNLTQVNYPNKTIFLRGEYIMTKNGSNYNYSFTNANTLGTYTYTACGDLNSVLTCQTTTFEVTYSGIKFDTSQSILYSGLLLVLIFFFVITLFGIGELPSSNTRDGEGKLISISWLKYLRSTLWFFEWLFLISILYVTSNLAFAYLGEQLFAKVLFVLFRICMGLTLPIVVIWFIWIFVNAFEDIRLKKHMRSGLFDSNLKW